MGEAIDLIVMDVSFISATLVLPAVVNAARAFGCSPSVVVLAKPQFEVGRELVGKGGIVRDAQAQRAAVTKVQSAMSEVGFEVGEAIDSPILGTEGNREFLVYGRAADDQ